MSATTLPQCINRTARNYGIRLGLKIRKQMAEDILKSRLSDREVITQARIKAEIATLGDAFVKRLNVEVKN